MAQNQPMRQNQQSGSQQQGNPGLSDVAYDVVTVMSNCGDAIDALEEYIQDCKDANDQDVARIFEQIRQDEVRHCQMLRDALTNLVRQGKF